MKNVCGCRTKMKPELESRAAVVFSWFWGVLEKVVCFGVFRYNKWEWGRFYKGQGVLQEPSGCSNLQCHTCYLTNATVTDLYGFRNETCFCLHVCTCVCGYKENPDISTTFDLFQDKSLLWRFVCSVEGALKITAFSVYSWYIYKTGWMKIQEKRKKRHRDKDKTANMTKTFLF